MNNKQRKWFHFLGPQHWPLWLAFFLLYIFSFLPYPTMVWLGKKIGRLFMRVSKRYRKITTTNITRCFPELSSPEQQALVRRHFESLGISIMETALAWWASDERIKKLVNFPDLSACRAVHDNGRGALLITGHFTTIELMGRITSLVAPIHIFIRHQNNQFFQWFSDKKRSKYIVSIIYKTDIKSLTSLILQRQLVCYFPDQNFSNRRHNTFVPFFGIQTSATIATSKIAKITHANIFSGFLFRNKDNRSYTFEVLEPLKDFPSGDDHADTARINHIIEIAARKHPEQYLWIHRRFKKRPEGEPAFYE